MAHVHHSHHHDIHGHGNGWEDLTAGKIRAVLAVVVVAAGLATIAGLIAWWPRGDSLVDDSALEVLGYGERQRARVTAAADEPCSFEPSETCHVVNFEITGGDDAGTAGSIEHLTGSDVPAASLDAGDRILVNDAGPGVPGESRYSFADMERGGTLWIVALVFAGAVVALGRWRGVLALSGLALSFAVILLFIFPAFLHGSHPIGVALTGASIIAFATLYLAHGFNTRTTVALLGTFTSLALIGAMAALFSAMAHLSGLADEEALNLLVFAPELDFRGLLLAAVIIGALGVLDDVTVTQTAAVWELHRASPSLSARELYSAGVRIGRDHIAATVNTLVLAYTAAAMPMLLLVSQSGLPWNEILGNETIAVEIIQTLVGSTGLVAAVPITTGLAAWVATRGRQDDDPAAPFTDEPPPRFDDPDPLPAHPAPGARPGPAPRTGPVPQTRPPGPTGPPGSFPPPRPTPPRPGGPPPPPPSRRPPPSRPGRRSESPPPNWWEQ